MGISLSELISGLPQSTVASGSQTVQTSELEPETARGCGKGSRKQGRSCLAFYDLVVEVTLCHKVMCGLLTCLCTEKSACQQPEPTEVTDGGRVGSKTRSRGELYYGGRRRKDPHLLLGGTPAA